MNQSSNVEYQNFQRIYAELLKEPKIRFVGFVDYMGNLIMGGFRNGVIPLKEESERQKIFLEVALRVRTREDFDSNVGPVKYASSRRDKIVMMTFPILGKILFLSTEPDVEIDPMARKIIKVCGIQSTETNNEIRKKKCVPCEGGISPLTPEEIKKNLEKVPGWKLKTNSIEREFDFGGFTEAIKFVNTVAELAEEEGHHPDICVHWNKVVLEIWTHAINGLSENDFVLASKVNKI
ncbi:MAG: 4a-hydroxytetrahydrobiopterin dehydratase [Nitrosopumilus sp.]|nr:4a-hydroxytetrahydrobiopterin dehydratase [Nitrosopumilus sp.]